MIRARIVFAAAALLALGTNAQAQNQSLQQLLEQVRSSVGAESRANQEREAAFLRDRNQQQSLLAQAKAELARLEAESEALKTEFDSNERRLSEFEIVVQERAGNLNELFGVVRQVSADVKGKIENSFVTAQFPERVRFLNDLAGRKELPTMNELRQLWFEIQREITESGAVATFNADIRATSGDLARNQTVTRIGVFTAVTQDGEFMSWQSGALLGEGRLGVLPRQPEGRWTGLIKPWLSTSPGSYAPMAVDFTRGVILSKVIETPTFGERIEQGGTVGYIIIGLGVFGLLFGLYSAVRLFTSGSGIASQLRNPENVNTRNPLGRVMSVYTENPDMDVETLELKLDEQIMRESAPIEAGLPLLKVIYVVAPLLGLLGTVVGMIITFQMITLYGTGDPKTMAGGISTALMTTVLGLVVAIPLTLLHSWLQSKARRLVQILEEEAAGIVALVAEKR